MLNTRKITKGMFYKVTKEKKSSFLLGTCHSLPEGAVHNFLIKQEQVKQALFQAERVVLEVLTSQVFDENEAKATHNSVLKWLREQGNMALNTETLIKFKESAEKMAAIDKIVNGDGTAPQSVVAVPLFAESILVNIIATYFGLNAKQPLDFVLELTARALEKPIFSLESPTEQLTKVFFGSAFSAAEQYEFVMSKLATVTAEQYINQIKEGLEVLQAIYLKDDLEAMVNVTTATHSSPTLEALQKKCDDQLITQRDHFMFENMQEHLSHGNAFIAIGSLHLPNIIMRLEKAGYIVEAIPLLATAKEEKISIPLFSQRQRLFSTPSNDAIQHPGHSEEKATKCTYHAW